MGGQVLGTGGGALLRGRRGGRRELLLIQCHALLGDALLGEVLAGEVLLGELLPLGAGQRLGGPVRDHLVLGVHGGRGERVLVGHAGLGRHVLGVPAVLGVEALGAGGVSGRGVLGQGVPCRGVLRGRCVRDQRCRVLAGRHDVAVLGGLGHTVVDHAHGVVLAAELGLALRRGIRTVGAVRGRDVVPGVLGEATGGFLGDAALGGVVYHVAMRAGVRTGTRDGAVADGTVAVALHAGLAVGEVVGHRDLTPALVRGGRRDVQLPPRAHGGAHGLGVEVRDVVEQRRTLVHRAVLHLVLRLTDGLPGLVRHDVAGLHEREPCAVRAAGEQQLHEVAQCTALGQGRRLGLGPTPGALLLRSGRLGGVRLRRPLHRGEGRLRAGRRLRGRVGVLVAAEQISQTHVIVSLQSLAWFLVQSICGASLAEPGPVTPGVPARTAVARAEASSAASPCPSCSRSSEPMARGDGRGRDRWRPGRTVRGSAARTRPAAPRPWSGHR